jgi:hypothetical protein
MEFSLTSWRFADPEDARTQCHPQGIKASTDNVQGYGRSPLRFEFRPHSSKTIDIAS